MRKNDGGFTMIELLIAFTIIFMGTLLTVYTLVMCANLTERTKENNIASYKLETVLEQLMSTPYSHIDSEFPAGVPLDLSAMLDSESANDLELNDEQIVVTYQDMDGNVLAEVGDNNPVRIICTITWIRASKTDDPEIRTMSYETIRAK